MMHLVVGTDVYGRVKSVAGTSVVTKFAMLEMIPYRAIASYYVWRETTTETKGIPFVFTTHSAQIHGLPLEQVDRISVVLTYVRVLCAGLMLLGSLGAITGLVTYWNGIVPMTESQRELTFGSVAYLILGCGVGLFSYVCPTTGRRERRIRLLCQEILNVAIDPARVSVEIAELIRNQILECNEQDCPDGDSPRFSQIRELILTRCARGNQESDWQRDTRTDELLDQLVSP